MQITSEVIMIKPYQFGYNDQTAVNNAFQVKTNDDVAMVAQREFDGLVNVLRSGGIEVTVFEDSPIPETPDAVFPNNWISFHEDNTICLYPMFAPNRRAERKPELLAAIAEKYNIKKIVDLVHYENENLFLEGTGSMVLDREHKIAYACLSPRTDIKVLEDFCASMQYIPVAFDAQDAGGKSIYHTNVMMSIADQYSIICSESITEPFREKVLAAVEKSGKELIEISMKQVQHFAGNMLQLKSTNGNRYLVMSSAAYNILNAHQLAQIAKYNKILHAPIPTIETNGGGSVRCMIAEVFR